MSVPLSHVEREQLGKLPLFDHLNPLDRGCLFDAMHLEVWQSGQAVLQEGDVSTALYIVLDGSARVTMRVGDRDVDLADLGSGTVFGEEGLLRTARRAATVTATTMLRCASVSAPAFHAHIAPFLPVRGQLEQLTFRRVRDRLVRSVSALHGLQLAGIGTDEVKRASFRAGQYDVINVTGKAALDGTLNLLFPGTYQGGKCDRFEIIVARAVRGDFATIRSPARLHVIPRYRATDVTLTIRGRPGAGRWDVPGLEREHDQHHQPPRRGDGE